MDFINRQIVKVHAAFAAREDGQALVEYGLVLVLVSIVAVVGLTAVSGQLYDASVATTMNHATGAITPANAPVFNKIIAAFS